MVTAVSDKLKSLAPSTSLYSSYVPLEKISQQLRRAVLEGDVNRLDRLWLSLQDRYSDSNLDECLAAPEPYSKNTNLILATQEKLVHMVEWLIGQGVEDGGMAKTAEGDTVLHIAASNDCPEIISLYHSKLADVYDDEDSGTWLVDWRNAKGASALSTACQKNSEESVMTLINLGASSEQHDSDGNTPLHHAAAYGNLSIIRLLLHSGANAFSKNNFGYTASDYAYSFQVEQEIQNTVRSVLEASKRARNAKPVASHRAPPSPVRDEHSDDDDNLAGTLKTPPLPKYMPQSLSPGSLPPLKLSTANLPPTTPSLSSSFSHLPLPTPTPTGSSSYLANPSLEVEHNKALQRIYARDQNAQADFQASAAYKGLVGPASTSSLPYSPHPKSSSVRRERSSSNEMTYASSSATSTSILSPSSSPPILISHMPRNEFPLPPIPPPSFPLPPLPNAESKLKSGTSSFASRLKRSGSGGSPSSATLEPSLMLKEQKERRTGLGLKHHASLADLRSQAIDSSPVSPMPVPSTPLYTPHLQKSSFHFGTKSRARAGT